MPAPITLPTWKGVFTEISEDPRNDIEIDRYGVAGATEYYWGPYNLAVGFILGKISHPLYPWLRRSKGVVSRQEANYAEVRITYAGVPPNTLQKTYRTTGATSTEPIETHPQFSDFAGTPSNPANGAKFDENGKFIGFVDPSNSKCGIRSYLSGSITFEETTVLGNLASGNNLSQLGKISSPPSHPCRPSTPGGRNWLLVSGTAEQIGETGGKVTKAWRLSAKRGWDNNIY
jgi:hypothetical protein